VTQIAAVMQLGNYVFVVQLMELIRNGLAAVDVQCTPALPAEVLRHVRMRKSRDRWFPATIMWRSRGGAKAPRKRYGPVWNLIR
jgi:hypothetical protein